MLADFSCCLSKVDSATSCSCLLFTPGTFPATIINVPDRRSRIPEVVIVRRIFNLVTGNLEWGGNEEGLRKGRSVHKQRGTEVDRILSQQGGFPSK
jgi:hypothetical protein